MVVAASSSSPRYTSDLEQARPQTSGEEELQLQLALAMSREEAEKVRPRNPTVVGRGWARGRMPGSPSALTQACHLKPHSCTQGQHKTHCLCRSVAGRDCLPASSPLHLAWKE